MSIRLFGHRVLLKYEKLKETNVGGIIIPDVAGKHDLHRTGRVQFLGNGRVFDPYKKQIETVPRLVRVGDLVMFQINDVMRWAQVYRHLEDDMLHLPQTELIARINGEQVDLTTFEILGDYVLVKPGVRQPKSKIEIPDTIKQAEMIHYIAIQKGSTVDLPFEVGQEIICNHGRVNPIFIPVRLPDKTVKQEEFGYVLKDFVHGVVDDGRALQA